MQSILGNTRKADIVFHSSGRIDITARVAKSLGLQHGDVIDIMLSCGEWFLYIKHHAPAFGRHEGMVFKSNAKGNHYRVWSKKLCNAVLHKCNVADKVKLCVGEPMENSVYDKVLPLITKLIL